MKVNLSLKEIKLLCVSILIALIKSKPKDKEAKDLCDLHEKLHKEWIKDVVRRKK